MAAGWFKVHRMIEENAIWQVKPYGVGQAWIDLILLANYADSTVIRRGVEVTVKRGQVSRSLRTLAERWGWSLGKVQRFLKLLKSAGQIDTQTGARAGTSLVTRLGGECSLITIVNYDKYQDSDTPSDTQTDTQTDTPTIHRRVPLKKERKKEEEKDLLLLSGHRIPLCDGTDYEVPLSKLVEWRRLFPNVDVPQELRNMAAWSAAAGRKKTRRGIERFAVNWLVRAQEKGRNLPPPPPTLFDPPKTAEQIEEDFTEELRRKGVL